jgi:phosphoesterase RecJ-like protein
MRAGVSRPPFREILRVIRAGRSFLCSSHVRADGDGLGSALAFSRILRKMGKRSHVVCELGAVPEYRFIPESETVGSDPGDLRPPYDALFTFDCANYERLGSVGEAIPADLVRVNIDHHVSNTRFGTIDWIDDRFASTTEMVYTFAREARVKLDRTLAVQLYVGLVTDTGSFSMSNTTVRSHEIAAELMRAGVKPVWVSDRLYRRKSLGRLKLMARFLGAIRLSADGRVAWAVLTRRMCRECGEYPYETQEYVNVLKSIRGVQAAVLIREMKEDPRLRVSWRTSEGVDGSKLASQWGGGGHRRASGALIAGGTARVVKDVIRGTVDFVARSK